MEDKEDEPEKKVSPKSKDRSDDEETEKKKKSEDFEMLGEPVESQAKKEENFEKAENEKIVDFQSDNAVARPYEGSEDEDEEKREERAKRSRDSVVSKLKLLTTNKANKSGRERRQESSRSVMMKAPRSDKSDLSKRKVKKKKSGPGPESVMKNKTSKTSKSSATSKTRESREERTPRQREERTGGSVKGGKLGARKPRPTKPAMTGLERTMRAAQAKQKASLTSRQLMDSEDMLPGSNTTGGLEDGGLGEDDVEGEQAILTDTSHRPDLVLVKNNDNQGKLHIGSVPFWKKRTPADKKPPFPKIAISAMFLKNDVPLKEPQDDPTDLDPLGEMELFESRDDDTFNWDQVQTNTMRTLLRTLDSSDCPEKEPGTIRVLPFKEPSTSLAYSRHHYAEKDKEVVPFKKSNIGVCKKKKRPTYRLAGSNSNSSSSLSTNSAASSSSSSSNTANLSPNAAANTAGRKKESAPVTTTKKIITPRQVPSPRKKTSSRDKTKK